MTKGYGDLPDSTIRRPSTIDGRNARPAAGPLTSHSISGNHCNLATAINNDYDDECHAPSSQEQANTSNAYERMVRYEFL